MAAPLDPETTPEEYRQRALLLADLGRYDEAAEEIAAGLSAVPDEPNLLATLARIHLAAEQPTEALTAASRAVSSAPDMLTTLVAQAMALTDTGQYARAAQVAQSILRNWPTDPYAQRTGAALLSESRNGQESLNAAWNAVRIAPAESEAHLVLAVVAARLRLFDLAQRAYAEALQLDPAVGEAQRDVGIVRFERRRWAIALEGLADQAVPFEQAPIEQTPTEQTPTGRSGPTSDEPQPEPPVDEPIRDSKYPEPFPRAYQAPDRPVPAEPAGPSSASWTEQPVIRPAGPVLDPSAESAEVIRRGVSAGANFTLVAGLLAGLMTLASEGISRMWAGLIGLLVIGGLIIWLNRALTERLGTALARLRAHDRRLATAAYLAFAAPLLLPIYALVGGVTPLIAGMVLAGAATMLILLRR
ncbi:MAG: tetratricopeptide repeat protein [Actinoplanes sp.]